MAEPSQSPERPRRLLLPPRPGVIRAERERRRAVAQWGSAAEAARKSLAEFTRQAWVVIEPSTPLVWNWHLDIICDALERQIRGEVDYRKLMILVPPGTMKSILVSVMAPAWEWLERSERRKAFYANDARLATRDSRRTREVVLSDWYLKLAAHCATNRGVAPWGLSKDQNEKVNFENTRRGFRQCQSIGAQVTGRRSDDVVIDDPHDAKEVVIGSVEQVRERLEETATALNQLANRVNRLSDARWTLIMQRVAADDYAGRCLTEGDWKVIQLQMEFEPGNPLNHPKDPRTKPGELLCPELFPAPELAKLKIRLGARHYSSQYQQRPMPADGGPLKRWYWCFWYPEGMDPPPPVRVTLPDGSVIECKQAPIPKAAHQQQTQSWDMAFKDTKDSAFVVGQVWSRVEADRYLLDQIREKLDFVASCDAVKSLSITWPASLEKLVEDKANGPAVLSELRRKVPGLVEVNPKGGKEARANAVAPSCRASNVWLPHPALKLRDRQGTEWVPAFLDETEAFPGGSYADQVDAATQYLLHSFGVTEWFMV